MKDICLITIVDGVSTTSIPINEFVLYRDKIRPNYRQIVITRTREEMTMVKMPSHIPVIQMPSNIISIRKLFRNLIRECNQKGEQVVIHLHHQKSALLFFFATLFMGLRDRTMFTVHSFYSNRDLFYKISSCCCTLLSNYTNCVSWVAYYDYPKWARLIKGNRMRVVLNGINCKRIDKAIRGISSHEDAYDINKMICVDRIIPIKNQRFIVGLMKSLPEMRLIFVGKEDKERVIRKYAEEEGVIDRIEFKGLIPRDEVYKIIHKCGFYVSASIVEGLHLSMLEAIKVGAIPIISDIPAHCEIAAKCHHLFKPLALEQELWIKIIRDYMSTDKTALRLLSDQLSKAVTDEFSLDKMHDLYDEIYNLIVN